MSKLMKKLLTNKKSRSLVDFDKVVASSTESFAPWM